jgi:O-antigen ligase
MACVSPLVMAFSRTSPPALAVIVCGLLVASAWMSGPGASPLSTLKRSALSLGGLALAAGLLLMAASLMWSLAPGRGANYLLQMAGSAVVIAAMLASLSRVVLHRLSMTLFGVGLALVIGLVAVIIGVHEGLSGPLLRGVGLGGDGYRLNRAAIAIALLLPLTVTLLWRRELRGVAVATGAFGAAGIVYSESESAKLVLALSVITAPLAFAAPRLVHRLAGAGVVLAFLSMPWVAPRVNELIPEPVHRAVGYEVLTLRGEMWREFATLYWQRPFLGFGLESSNVIAGSSEAAALPDRSKRLLNQSHPHNGPLQVWFELGAVGALVGAALIALGWRALDGLPASVLPLATTTAVGASAVFFVSHGAWQAWWYSLLGLVAVLFGVVIDKGREPVVAGSSVAFPSVNP